MDSTEFLVLNAFELMTKKTFVLSGIILKGKVSENMILKDKGSDVGLKINSVEEIKSTDLKQQTGLTFVNLTEPQIKYLYSLCGLTIVFQ